MRTRIHPMVGEGGRRGRAVGLGLQDVSLTGVMEGNIPINYQGLLYIPTPISGVTGVKTTRFFVGGRKKVNRIKSP